MSTAFAPAALAVLALVAAPSISPAAGPAPCIRIATTCYPTIQTALDAAPDGSSVLVPAGHFAGGLTITTSVTLRGAGAGKTVISGGEHVVTVGTLFAPTGTQPTVDIVGVTITGGHATDFAAFDIPHVQAGGGGVLMLPDADWGGATLTITDSVVSGNSATPTATLLPPPDAGDGWPSCPQGPCAYAGALGGGIEAIGSLTLVRTTVTSNSSGGPLASDSDGGGIWFGGTLSLIDSVVSDNHAIGAGVNARYAEGGGIFGEWGSLSLLRSTVSGNDSALQVTWPETVNGVILDTGANSGGIHFGDDGSVSIVSSHIDGNRTTFDNPNGSWGALNAGAQFGLNTTLVMKDSTLSGNALTARVANGDLGPMGGAIEWDGNATISGSRFIGNTVAVTALHGDADVWAAVAALSGISLVDAKTVMTDSVISGNVSTATTKTGKAQVLGAGLISETDLTLTRVVVTGNKGIATGVGGTAVGGGIATGALILGPDQALPSSLHLVSTTVTGNSLTGSAGVTLSGGGIYSDFPVSLSASVVAGNHPDQCVGCGSTPGQSIIGPWHFTWPRHGDARVPHTH